MDFMAPIWWATYGSETMKFVRFLEGGVLGLAVAKGDNQFRGATEQEAGYSTDLDALIGEGAELLASAAAVLQRGRLIDLDKVTLLPPLPKPGKILCVGLNYIDHSKETGFELPDYPLIFARFASTLIGHDAPIQAPRISEQLDYEGEFVAVIGKRGKRIPKAQALDYV